MRMKKKITVALIISTILLLSAIVVVAYVNISDYRIKFTEFYKITLVIEYFSIPSVICLAIALIFFKRFESSCSIPTTLCAFVTSASAGFVLYCFLISSFWSYGGENHPLQRLAFTYGSIICIIAALTAIITYCLLRIKKTSVFGILFDVFFGIVFIIPFMMFTDFSHGTIANIIASYSGM